MIKGMPDLGCFFSSHQPTHNTSLGKSLNSPHAKHPKSWWCNPKSKAISNSQKKKQNHQDKTSWFLTRFFFTCLEFRDTFFKLHSFQNPLSFFPSDLANFLQNLKGDEITVPSEGRNVLHESMSCIYCIFSQVGYQRQWNRIGHRIVVGFPNSKKSKTASNFYRSFMCKVRIRPLFGAWIWTAEGRDPNSVLKNSMLCQYSTEKHQHKQTNSSCLLRVCHTRKMNLENTRNPNRTGFLHHAGLQVLNWHSSPEHSKRTQLKCWLLMEFESERWTFDFESFDATTKRLFFFGGGHSMQNRNSMPTKSPKFDLEWLPAGHMVPTWNPSTLKNKQLVTWLSYNATVIS